MTRILKPAAATLVAALTLGAAPLPTTDVTVTVTNLRSDKGQVFACLASEHDPFPRCHGSEQARRLVIPTSDAHQFRFRNVPAGRYAVALLHDENKNRKMDRVLMVPREGFGFSRNAKVRMGPPEFGDAAFQLAGDDPELAIRMRYLM